MTFRPDPKPEPKPKKVYTLPQRKKPIPQQTAKNKEKRQAERILLPGFYEALIMEATKNGIHCDNCGAPIYSPDSSNFAHILSKRIYVEV